MPPKKQSKNTTIDMSKNYYDLIGDGFKTEQIHYSNESKMNISVPFNMAIIGSTGSRKTNWLMSLIEYVNCFTKINLYVKVPDEPLYAYLTKTMQDLGKKLKLEIITVHDNIDDLIEVEEYKKDRNEGEVILNVWDDLVNEKSKKLSKVGNYFTFGRKYNICNVFISQSYFKIPQIIRQNCQYLVFQKIKTKRDLLRILDDNTFDVDPKVLLQFYAVSQKLKKAFMIDSRTNDEKLRYRLDEKSIYDFL